MSGYTLETVCQVWDDQSGDRIEVDPIGIPWDGWGFGMCPRVD